MDCVHPHLARIAGYDKCTSCGEVWAQNQYRYDPNCPDCEFETHRCGVCGEQLDHTEKHRCLKAYR